MAYWWVNHNQTFKSEFEGGYIWSPKTKKDGTFNQTYLNLTLAKAGDVVFSFADTFIKAVGIVNESYIKAPVPPEFGTTGNQWNNDGYLVKINWIKLEYPLKPKDNIEAIKGLLPKKYSPLQQNGNGNQGVYLVELSPILGKTLINLIDIKNNFIRPDIDAVEKVIEEEKEVNKIKNSNISNLEKEQLVTARLGQGIFKKNVSKIEKGCRITDVTNSSFLIASHIKPWCKSDNREKLDGNNGLLLSPHVDKLFDRGHISFSNDGDILIKEEVKKIFKDWKLEIKNVGNFNKEQQEYLAYHRKKHNF